MNYVLLAAAGVSAVALVLHFMLGRAHPVAEPVQDDDWEVRLRADAFFGRHLQTIFLMVMTFAFSHACRHPDAYDVAFWLGVIALTASAFRMLVGLRTAAPLLDLPEWGLLALSGVLAIVGSTWAGA